MLHTTCMLARPTNEWFPYLVIWDPWWLVEKFRHRSFVGSINFSFHDKASKYFVGFYYIASVKLRLTGLSNARLIWETWFIIDVVRYVYAVVKRLLNLFFFLILSMFMPLSFGYDVSHGNDKVFEYTNEYCGFKQHIMWYVGTRYQGLQLQTPTHPTRFYTSFPPTSEALGSPQPCRCVPWKRTKDEDQLEERYRPPTANESTLFLIFQRWPPAIPGYFQITGSLWIV